MNTPLRQSAISALLLAMLAPAAARAQLQVVPDKELQRVFTGEGRRLTVLLRNPSESSVSAELRTRLYQASSVTAMPLGEAPWKKLEVLPGQTVLESAPVTFPAVKAETRFVVQWLEGANKVMGRTEVAAYPPDLLKDLKPLAGKEPLGVFDPQNQLKPLLKAVAVEIEDLEETGLEGYRGKLAIIGPFQSRAQMGEEMGERSRSWRQRALRWCGFSRRRKSGRDCNLRSMRCRKAKARWW